MIVVKACYRNTIRGRICHWNTIKYRTCHRNMIGDKIYHRNMIRGKTYRNMIGGRTYHRNMIRDKTCHRNMISDGTCHRNMGFCFTPYNLVRFVTLFLTRNVHVPTASPLCVLLHGMNSLTFTGCASTFPNAALCFVAGYELPDICRLHKYPPLLCVL